MSFKYLAVAILVTLVLTSSALCLWSQKAQNNESNFKSEEYLLLGDATRGAGEPMIAVDPTNPKNMIAVAMGNLQQLPGVQSRAGTNPWPSVGRSTITWLAITHDGGVNWKIGELPILYSNTQRCPDSLVDVTKDGVFIAGCEPRQTTPGGNESSSIVVSRDKGETWSAPAEIVGYSKNRFAPGLNPKIGGAAPYDRPFTTIDDSTGVIYGVAQGGTSEDGGKVHNQGYITASTDGGKSFGTIYSWDSKDYPQSSRGLGEAAGFGEVAVIYAAASVPAKEQAACPCAVFGLSRDQGKTFTYRVLKGIPAATQAASGSAVNPPSNMEKLAADQTKSGRFAILTYISGTNPRFEVTVTEDHGQMWSQPVNAGSAPGAVYYTKTAFKYSRDGVLALMWRAVYSDETYDIWTTLSKDGGKSFSTSLRVSHARSPRKDPVRAAGNFGDDIQDLSMDKENVHMVWGDSRAGFQAVFYGRVPFSGYEFKR